MRGARWLLVGTLGCSRAPAVPAAPPPPPAPEESAVESSVRIIRDRDQSLFSELGRRGLAPGDVPAGYPAAAVDQSVDAPLGLDLGLTLGGRPVFFVKDGAAVVDTAVFGPLSRVDATNPPDTWAPVGRLAAPDGVDLGAAVRLLVQADLVLTWAHIGSELTLTPVAAPPPKARGAWRLRGTHTYFTNTENTDEIDVGVVVSEDGLVLVGPPPPAG